MANKPNDQVARVAKNLGVSQTRAKEIVQTALSHGKSSAVKKQPRRK